MYISIRTCIYRLYFFVDTHKIFRNVYCLNSDMKHVQIIRNPAFRGTLNNEYNFGQPHV